MHLTRFLLPLLGGLLLERYVPLHHRFSLIRNLNDSPWEMTKLVFFPLLIQTVIEAFLTQSKAYLPARFSMILIALIVFLSLQSCQIVLKTTADRLFFYLAYFISFISSFLFEASYFTKNIAFHPYDPAFASIGLIFLTLLFILNSFAPPDCFLFSARQKNQN